MHTRHATVPSTTVDIAFDMHENTIFYYEEAASPCRGVLLPAYSMNEDRFQQDAMALSSKCPSKGIFRINLMCQFLVPSKLKQTDFQHDQFLYNTAY